MDELKALAELEKKQNDDGSKGFVDSVINIDDARKANIMPIPYDWTSNRSDFFSW